jgi:hypothetical protein
MTNTASNKIDSIRNAAFTDKIGSSEDASPIREFIEIDGMMYIVKDNGIYSYKLADQIDPKRTNIDMQNVQQRVAKYGATDEVVCRTLLTGKKLFKKIHLGQQFDEVRALSRTFEMMLDLLAAKEIAMEFRKSENAGKEAIINRKDFGYGFALPSSSNLKADVKSFIQRMDHTYVSLFEIVILFYPDCPRVKWFDSFCEYIEKKYSENEKFVEMLEDSLWFLRFIRNMRTGIEHRAPDQEIKIRDFELAPDSVHLPSIEVLNTNTPHARVSIADLSAFMVDRFSKIAELMFAFMSDLNATDFAGMPLGVFILPEEQRGQNKLVRFSYGTTDGTHIIPMS